jgi:phosphatidylglycerol:prolipoprotein diacylglycerol transferase
LRPEVINQILAAGNFRAYIVLGVLGTFVGGYLIRMDARGWALDHTTKFNLLAVVFIGGLAGAALPGFVAGDFVESEALRYAIGPKTVLGGILFGFFSVAVFNRLADVRIDTSDAFARGIALGLAVGRIGCFFGHCCFGICVDHWGVDMGDGQPRLPIQLIEAGILFALFLYLNRCHRKEQQTGKQLFLFFLCYGIARFFLEFGREPVAGVFWGLGFYQWLALVVASVGAFQLVKRSSRRFRFLGEAVS